ncbi:hypothetical protein B0I35DRAFT_90259 [Stachybotrys elegans]|uniref:Uncharacterized protein n=1 Tax=Stachybotrys elegans TaxID=80388 RepID=A0A8K0SG77_9HYPO|nr:hypothetical protein B0I35DRAFT_90259 [Stachybotrys elegans]
MPAAARQSGMPFLPYYPFAQTAYLPYCSSDTTSCLFVLNQPPEFLLFLWQLIMSTALAPAPVTPRKALADPDRGVHTSIRRERNVLQSRERVPDEFFLKPSDAEGFVPTLIPAIYIEPFQREFGQLPVVHIVGRTADRRYYEVAMTTGFLYYLVKNDYPVKPLSEITQPYHVSQPTEGEVRVHGYVNAVVKARKSFIRNAIDAIVDAKYGRGLDSYYRDYADPQLSAAIQWGCLLRDVMESSPGVRRRFFQHCTLILVHSTQDVAETAEADFMERTEDEWLLLVEELCNDRAMAPVDDPTAESQLFALVQAVFHSAIGKPIRRPASFDMSYSAKENIERLSVLFDSGVQPHAVPFGSYDETQLDHLLRHCELFKGITKDDIPAMTAQIIDSVPVGFSNMDFLPVQITYRLRYETVSLIRDESANLYRQLAVPRVPENDLLVFLCSCASLHTVDASICEWVASSEGNNLYKTLLRGFQSKEMMQQTALRVLALFNFERLLPPRPDETFEPIHGCYMSDFCLHLEGQFLSNRRTVMARMASSFCRVVGQRCFPGVVGGGLEGVEARSRSL